MLAGINQAANRWGAYGQGAEGYAKRYAATYADVFTATLLGGAVLPSLLKQDPRYFYKGVGSKRSRFLYAVANTAICKPESCKAGQSAKPFPGPKTELFCQDCMVTTAS